MTQHREECAEIINEIPFLYHHLEFIGFEFYDSILDLEDEHSERLQKVLNK